MKKLILTASLIFLCSVGHSKNKLVARFYFSQLCPEMIDNNYAYQWTLNGVTLNNSQADTVELNIHYPLFDTIALKLEGHDTRTIITRFKANKIYELRPSTQYYDIDILDPERTPGYQHTLSQYSSNNYPLDSLGHCDACGIYDSTAFRAETGNIKFKLKNHNDNEFIAATYGRISERFTTGALLDQRKTVSIAEPLFLGGSAYCFHINIGTGNALKEHEIYNDFRNLRFYLDDQNTFVFNEQYVSFEYRFLNRETLLVTYDAKTKTASLKLED
jgi:hypothetical protein